MLFEKAKTFSNICSINDNIIYFDNQIIDQSIYLS